jgi:protein phosphatase
MGTTIAGLWRIGILDEAAIFHVGDSRLYLYRAGRLILLTRDHTLYQQWVSSGCIGPAPSQNIILRSLGSTSRVNADVRLQSLQNGDLILLCSDGLTSMVSDAQIESTLANVDPECLQTACESLVEKANAEGGKDNITVLLAWFE